MLSSRRRIDSHVHFFLGKDCSQDESGTAALKAVELDQALGDEPIQHRCDPQALPFRDALLLPSLSLSLPLFTPPTPIPIPIPRPRIAP